MEDGEWLDLDLEMEGKGSAQGGDSAHRFYISSPYLGLIKEREKAKQLITRRNHAYGDSYGGSADPLVETCQRDVRASDHYVLILGERYDTRQPEHGDKSVAELEFEAAVETGLSLHAFALGFVSDSDNGIEWDAEAQAALTAFRQRVSDYGVLVDRRDQAVSKDANGSTSRAIDPRNQTSSDDRHPRQVWPEPVLSPPDPHSPDSLPRGSRLGLVVVFYGLPVRKMDTNRVRLASDVALEGSGGRIFIPV